MQNVYTLPCSIYVYNCGQKLRVGLAQWLLGLNKVMYRQMLGNTDRKEQPLSPLIVLMSIIIYSVFTSYLFIYRVYDYTLCKYDHINNY